MKPYKGSVPRRMTDKFAAERAALKTRNIAIAQKAVRGGKSYSELAREYHLSRERIRQIVEFLNPVAYRQRGEAWKKRKKIENYGLCPKCGAVKGKRDIRPRRRAVLVDPEGRYCMACVRKMSKQKVTLLCRCGRKRPIPAGMLLYLISQGRYKSVRLSPDGKTGTYLCLPCYRTDPRKPEAPSITLACRCGRKRKMSLRALLCIKDRGGYKSARPAADGKTGTYVCLLCYRATRKSARSGKKHKRRRTSCGIR